MGRAATIVSLDPWGAMVADVFAAELAAGYDIRPTIAVTKAHVILPEIIEAIAEGPPAAPTARSCCAGGAALVTKAAIEPVWYLPGVAQRFGCSETDLRRVLFEETGGMYPGARHALATSRCSCRRSAARPSTSSATPRDLADPDGRADRPRARRVQRLGRLRLRHLHLPALPHARDRGVHPAARSAAASGLVAYSRKEGRALGEVTKFLVYNARKRQVGGDTADQYFARTECVAGVQDMRFQELMPDVLHWLGITQDPPPGVDEQHEVRRHHRLAASRSASA